MAGFEKDRYFRYNLKAWYAPDTPTLYLFPHWNWASGTNVTVWAYSNADSVELFLNGTYGRSLGMQTMAQYGHVEWDNGEVCV